MSADTVYKHFYRTMRLSASELSDGGGPFGFDVTTALEFDFLIERYQCDAIIETGSNMGDTTEYLARTYPHLNIVTCDVMDKYVDIVRRRVGFMPHTYVEKVDSPELIAKFKDEFRCPLYYLDAHWYEDWPLERELALIDNGVVCVDDFNIGHPRFGYDKYGEIECGPQMLSRFIDKIPHYYTNNPEAQHELPCLQTGRRGGKAYFAIGQRDHMKHHRYFRRHETPRPSG
ncbi:hypothetical protein [Marilutibacter chinensis]|uniref:Methyltransferase family protein n=1 Tax=Marilutibacter chinensis TaxID=2912247 RepID=A0ABS9HWT6_9GAMM|nr:hypothetical protein [Lysobacter chinensis]MCF7223351.1 hypothetical protein [Lysobacter chinensis]